MSRHAMVNGVRVDYTAEQEAERDAEETAWAAGANARNFKKLRKERDRLLADTDFYALSDVTMSSEMESYRQALRDLPAAININYWPSITWPTTPS